MVQDPDRLWSSSSSVRCLRCWGSARCSPPPRAPARKSSSESTLSSCRNTRQNLQGRNSKQHRIKTKYNNRPSQNYSWWGYDILWGLEHWKGDKREFHHMVSSCGYPDDHWAIPHSNHGVYPLPRQEVLKGARVSTIHSFISGVYCRVSNLRHQDSWPTGW